ncbi:MAG: glutamate--tRNA ligase [Chloroflexi bacterium]|nr:glutamate--tRNA ligase [Chloroflexota bacterium]
MSVRVRYAPSPTGEPHVGNIRSALFNWLYARSTGGTFIVRIEDTDRARLVPGAEDAILDALEWLGLDWDEGPRKGGPFGPYVQSERKALGIYQEHADRLVADGAAYPCYCTPARLDAMRKEQQAGGRSPGYDRNCLDPTKAERARAENPVGVVRFKMPVEGTIVVHDLVRGDVSFEASLLDDFVLLKSDGFPTYHLANVVDDHLMEITHVMRAEEWLPSAPRHQELYKALGFEMPHLVHLPMILGPDRSKLSKRHGATSALHYRDDGYLPQAMFNFLALLGWSMDDATDVISREELVAHFSIERILASPAVFNAEKLDWFNGVYIRQMATEELAEAILPWLTAALPDAAIDRDYLQRIIPLERERLRKLSEAPEMLSFFFEEQPALDPKKLVGKGMDRDGARGAIEGALAVAEGTEPWTADALEPAYRALAESLGVSTGGLFGAMRAAVTGRTAAPPLFDTMEVLGRDRCLARLRHALGVLGG